MFPFDTIWFIVLLIPLMIWNYFWKIPGLWFSARNNEKKWFIIFVFVNLAGILEIYYLHSRKCWPFKPKKS
ncbi:MAG: DUF5652 family protein [Candidatus Bathyarchaeia archaeon]|nr:hypothetical protein [Candidatus Bathyarchaeota archaeon]